MNEKEIKSAAKAFADYWKDKGYEKGESQAFWLSLLCNVYGVEHPEQFISFEDQVKLDHTSFIDGYIDTTHVMIEQKGLGKDLRKGIKQSDGSILSPFQQAKRYAAELPYSKRPRWIITCNFAEFLVYDMEKPNSEPEQIFLKDLPQEYYRLQFLVDTDNENIKKEMEISLKAGELVGALYDAILKQYKNPDDPETLKSLNKLCVRLVFCLYAEDAGIFGKHGMFHDYLKKYPVNEVRHKLVELFRILDTKENDRDPYLDEDLLAFPYVNGGLFADENIEIPRFTEEIVHLLLNNASENFDWSGISPTIFGAVFESTLNPETRRKGGMHYTSIENIHKVIDPLFLDALKAELEDIKSLKVKKTQQQKLHDFRQKLSTLVFLDPAAGSGNFLTETYISLRRLENEALFEETHGQMMLGMKNVIQVNIGQFYGIEINDFAVTVAKTALWIAESQMMQETETLMQINLDFLPLKSYANIVEGNALRIDWESVVPKDRLSYIMGNPPFVGHQMRSSAQVDDMAVAFYDLPKHGKLDYVCAWYNKAADLMAGTCIKASFVSTNSIIQGESVGILWRFLFEKKNVEIQFAHQSFIWDSEANLKAHVHCVIIGFTIYKTNTEKLIFSNGSMLKVSHINGYLLSAPDVFIQSRGKPLYENMPEMSKGSQPTDGGNLIFSKDERKELIALHPEIEPFIHRYISADDYINNKYRYCIWLYEVSPAKYRNIPTIMKRLELVAECRRKSPTASVKLAAETPMIFTQIRQPSTMYLAMPEVSSSRRRYIPFGYMSPDVIASNMLYLVPNVDLYMFGVMTSNVHMSWLRVVGGRLKSDYRYTPAVYNNFPWCHPTDAQRAKIEHTAQMILDARAKYPDCSLADLYDETTMPPELRKAHQLNDRAVMEAYGFWGKLNSESECVAELMGMYREMTEVKKK
ncbi:MAG: class I SAM-dependent DNA methyltransferase [Oscillospiraceae bacterium]|nr:class I SAM-dependent DNA methyltransferase [Oscillospiraceae bacterium]